MMNAGVGHALNECIAIAEVISMNKLLRAGGGSKMRKGIVGPGSACSRQAPKFAIVMYGAMIRLRTTCPAPEPSA
jgi:hypothetical protein